MVEIVHGWPSKGIVAAFLATVVEVIKSLYGGEGIIIAIWLGFFLLDFLMGSLKAIVWHEWSLAKLTLGLRKFMINLGSIAIINLLCLSLTTTIDMSVSVIVNAFIFILTLTDCISAISHAESMGWEIPPILKFIVNKWRKKSLSFMIKQLGEEDGDPEVLAFIASQRQQEEGCRRSRKNPDTGLRRRATDSPAEGEKSERDKVLGYPLFRN